MTTAYNQEADRRKDVQKGLEWLATENWSWLLNQLLNHGPMTEEALRHARKVSGLREEDKVPIALWALWITGNVWIRSGGLASFYPKSDFTPGAELMEPMGWRISLGSSCGNAGEWPPPVGVAFLYGIRGVHFPTDSQDPISPCPTH